MTYTETEIALAKAFDAALRADIGAADYAEVLKRNLTDRYSGGACASHDFCDANMVMLAAYEGMTGSEFPDADDITDADMDLWNNAWSAWRKATERMASKMAQDWTARVIARACRVRNEALERAAKTAPDFSAYEAATSYAMKQCDRTIKRAYVKRARY